MAGILHCLRDAVSQPQAADWAINGMKPSLALEVLHIFKP
jgi:hypothetical protein